MRGLGLGFRENVLEAAGGCARHNIPDRGHISVTCGLVETPILASPQSFSFAGSKICISNKLPARPTPLLPGPCFENHGARGEELEARGTSGKEGHKMKGDEERALGDPSGGQADPHGGEG